MKILVLLLILPCISFAKDFVPNSFSANFVQTNKSSASGKDMQTLGKIDYKYPGHLRFEITEPNRALVVINPEKTWNVQISTVKTEKDQATVTKTSDFPLIKFFDSVKTGLGKSKLFTTKYEKNDVLLTFDQKVQKEMGYESITLHSSVDSKTIKELKDFETITINRYKASPTKYEFTNYKENPSLSADVFNYIPTTNTKVIQN